MKIQKKYIESLLKFTLNTKQFVIALYMLLILSSCSKGKVVSDLPKNNLDSSITYIFENNYHQSSFMPHLSVERSFVYNPGENDWHYAHHPSIVFFNGKMIAIFSNGIHGEDEGGQRVAISTSTNFTSWTTPTTLVSTGLEQVLTPGGLVTTDNAQLVSYFTENDFSENGGRPNANLYALTSSDGTTWSSPVDLNIRIFPSHRPTKLSTRRLVSTGNRDFYYTDNLDGISGWTKAVNSPFKIGETATLVEGAIIEHGDSVYTVFRDVGKKFLWQESSLTGEKWTVPKKTKFTDNNSKVHMGKLPDGRYYYVGVPDTLKMGERTPLVLSLSSDGFIFNKNYIIANDHYAIKYNEGRWKTGQFGYPYSIIHDEYMYVIVSRRKEAIEVIRFSLSQLD